MKKSTIASLIGLAFSTPTFAAENIYLDYVIVKANRFEHKDTETTYASEIHTAKQIEESGAATLYDFLAQQTSLNVLSSFGNKLTPSINLRGFGNENGYQNVVITVDGQRLNNNDQSSQLLGAIPLGNIERIEIAKGSGSVIYGDGATAGAIQIYTKKKTGVTVSASLGNYGQNNSYINAGISEQHIDLSASLAHDSFDGFSKKDATGQSDQSTSNTQNVKLTIKPIDGLKFIAEGTSSRNDVRYVSPLTRQEFKNDPRSAGLNSSGGVNTYTHQGLNTDQWKLGTEYQINDAFNLSATHFREDKTSEFPTFAADYDYEGNEIALSFNADSVSAIAGFQNFDGDRETSSDVTSKDNRAFFVNAEYRPSWISKAITLSAGARHENVDYTYKPTFGNKLNQDESLNAWDIGANYRFTSELSAFVNYNKSFQAPDIDRFFGFDASFNTVFNGLIDPAKVKTLNVGINHVVANNRLKVTAFRADIDDEIYLDPTLGFFGTNSNLDKTNKYGVEVQDYFKLNDQLNASFIYNYTRSIIDRENALGGLVIKNKDLPGAPKHAVIANLNYKFLSQASLNLNHTWRSKSYVFNDFLNNAPQKQDNYESTNIALNYQYENLNFFTSVNNIFEHKNSIQTSDDITSPGGSTYAVDFVRTWRIGMKADF
ncbi:MAG: TonB-dependent receptor [Methylotenera sp.]|nr:TonB-dependent receptor [Methylotenera sp.]